MNDPSADQRMETLEIHAAEQDKTIDDLSGQIRQQWQTIDKLQKQLEALTLRFLTLEAQSHFPAPITRPPHY